MQSEQPYSDEAIRRAERIQAEIADKAERQALTASDELTYHGGVAFLRHAREANARWAAGHGDEQGGDERAELQAVIETLSAKRYLDPPEMAKLFTAIDRAGKLDRIARGY